MTLPKLFPAWFESIRSVLALLLTGSYCYGKLTLKLPETELVGLKELALLVLTFYFVLKKRDEGKPAEGGNGNV